MQELSSPANIRNSPVAYVLFSSCILQAKCNSYIYVEQVYFEVGAAGSAFACFTFIVLLFFYSVLEADNTE